MIKIAYNIVNIKIRLKRKDSHQIERNGSESGSGFNKLTYVRHQYGSLKSEEDVTNEVFELDQIEDQLSLIHI